MQRGDFQNKKNLRIRAGWCKTSSTKSVPEKLTYQYLWDSQNINLLGGQTSEHSQQRIAKCKQRFVFPRAGFNY